MCLERIAKLIAFLGDADPQVRFRAVWVLGKSQDPRAFDTTLQLTQDPDASVAYDATLALAELGDPRALAFLHRLAGTSNTGALEIALSRLG